MSWEEVMDYFAMACMLYMCAHCFMVIFWPYTFVEGKTPRYYCILYYIDHKYDGTNCVAVGLLARELQWFV